MYDPAVSDFKGHLCAGMVVMQASPDLAYGARVQSIDRLEENRRKN